MAAKTIKINKALIKELDRDLLHIYVSSDIDLQTEMSAYSPSQLHELLGKIIESDNQTDNDKNPNSM